MIHGKFSKKYYDLDNSLFDFQNKSFLIIIKSFLKSILLTFKSNKIKQYLYLILNKKSLCIGSPSLMIRENAFINKTFLVVLNTDSISIKKQTNIENELKDIIIGFFNKINKEICGFFDIKIDNEKIVNHYLIRSRKICNFFNKKNFFNFSHIYGANSSKPSTKILATHLKNNKNIIYAQEHGNNNYSLQNKFLPTLYVGYDKFLCPNDVCAKNLENNIYKFHSDNINFFPQTISCKLKSKYKTNYNQSLKNINLSKIKILLVGCPMGPIRSPVSPGNFFYYRFFLEKQILDAFKLNNFCIDYKLHPDRVGWEKFFKLSSNKIIYDKFEKIYNSYDVIIFTYTSTTCFNLLLSSSKPCIIFNTDLNQWNKNDLIFLETRCHSENLSFIEQNSYKMVSKDKKNLEHIINSSIKKSQNFEYKENILNFNI